MVSVSGSREKRGVHGVKGIRLGPTLPAFMSPNVLKVLVEEFNVRPVADVATDIDAMIKGQ